MRCFLGAAISTVEFYTDKVCLHVALWDPINKALLLLLDEVTSFTSVTTAGGAATAGGAGERVEQGSW